MTCPGYKEVQKNAVRVRRPRRDSSSISVADNSAATTPPRSQPAEFVDDSDPSTSTAETSPIAQHDLLNQSHSGTADAGTWPGVWHRQSIAMPIPSETRSSWSSTGLMKHRLSHDVPVSRNNSMPNGHSSDRKTNQFDDILFESFYKAITLVPSITFSTECEIWDDIASLTDRWSSITQSILSFASTYMHFITDDPQYSRAAIIYRGAALQALQNDMRSGPEGIDAAIAASILLADQAAFEGDWQASILHHRGLTNLCTHNSAMSSSSMFAKTRSFDPGKRLVQRRKINVDCIQSTPDGFGCYSSLQYLREFMAKQTDRPALCDVEFLGSNIAGSLARSSSDQELQYVGGGLGHLLAIACDVHETHAELCKEVAVTSNVPLLQSLVLQYQEESNSWLSDLPQSIISEAFDGDLTSVVLLTYKFSLDLLLHRCTLLARKTPLLPPPSAVMAITYIHHAYQVVTSAEHYADSEDRRLFIECMNWPLWVLSWAKQFTSKDKVQAIALQHDLALSAGSPLYMARSLGS